MGITFRHDAAAGLIGAYAAGQSARRRRGQKYAMDMLQKQQQHRQRMRATGVKRRALAGPQAEGQWNDPLAPAGLEGQDAVTQRAQRRGRARKYRMGKDVPAEWQPQFTSQDEIDAKREQDEDKRQWERKVADEKARDQRELGQSQEAAAAAREHAEDMQIDRGLQSGKLVLSPFAQNKIREARDEYVQAEASGRNTPEQLDEARMKTEERIRKLKRTGASPPEQPSDIDRAGQTAGYFQDGKFVQGARPGGRPEYQAIDGKFVPIPPPAETSDQIEQKARQEQQAEYQKYVRGRRDKIIDDWRTAKTKDTYKDNKKTVDDAFRADLYALERERVAQQVVPQQPQPQAQVQPLSPHQRAVAGQQPAWNRPQARQQPRQRLVVGPALSVGQQRIVDQRDQTFVQSMTAKKARGEELTPQEIGTLRTMRERMAR